MLRSEFIEWSTSKDYIALVAKNEGWANVPPGARTSLYETPEYQDVPFAKMTLDSINAADPNNPTVKPVPYVGIQFVAIPEFAGIATEVSQEFSAVYAGTTDCGRCAGQGSGFDQRRNGSSWLPLSHFLLSGSVSNRPAPPIFSKRCL